MDTKFIEKHNKEIEETFRTTGQMGFKIKFNEDNKPELFIDKDFFTTENMNNA